MPPSPLASSLHAQLAHRSLRLYPGTATEPELAQRMPPTDAPPGSNIINALRRDSDFVSGPLCAGDAIFFPGLVPHQVAPRVCVYTGGARTVGVAVYRRRRYLDVPRGVALRWLGALRMGAPSSVHPFFLLIHTRSARAGGGGARGRAGVARLVGARRASAERAVVSTLAVGRSAHRTAVGCRHRVGKRAPNRPGKEQVMLWVLPF